MNKIIELNLRTYIYHRDSDNICVHVNAGYGFIGKEYEHLSEPDWQPPIDWPYEIIDQR